MADDEKNIGFSITPKNLGFTLSLLTLTTIIFGGFSTVNSYAFKIEKIENDYKNLSLETGKLADQIIQVNGQLVTLTITLNRMEERIEARIRK